MSPVKADSSLMGKLLSLSQERVISITGAGGKTSLLCLYAKTLAACGYSVLVTTTTHLMHPSLFRYPVDRIYFDFEMAIHHNPVPGETVFFAAEGRQKVSSPGVDAIIPLSGRYDYTIVEADGARRLPLKLHTDRDPVVVPSSFTVAVMGLSSLGKRRSEVCFGDSSEGVVDLLYLQHLLDHPEGALKGMKKGAVVLNQADLLTEEEREALTSLRARVPVIPASVREDILYL